MGLPVIEQAWQTKEKPEDVADWILGEIPPNYYEQLEGLTYERVTAISPRYGQIDRQWLEQVLSRVRQEAGSSGEEADAGSG